MKDEKFRQILRIIHSERPLTADQRDSLQKIIDSDEDFEGDEQPDQSSVAKILGRRCLGLKPL